MLTKEDQLCADGSVDSEEYEEAIGSAEGLNEGIGCMPMIGFVPMDGTCRRSDRCGRRSEDRSGCRRIELTTRRPMRL